MGRVQAAVLAGALTELERAGVWRRVAARLVDTAVGVAVWGLCGAWLILGVWGLGGLPHDGRGMLLLLVALLVLAGALHLVYHVVFVGGCGQTPGRMVTGIAVVDGDGGVPGYGRALLRSLAGALNGLVLGLLSLPLVFTRERRGFADWLAGTRVVRAARPTAPAA